MNKSTIILLLTMLTLSCKGKTDSSSTIEDAEKIKMVDVEEAKKLIQEVDELVILDVRTAKEVSQGKIKDAINIDVKNSYFSDNLGSLDKDLHYLVHCKSGKRSKKATKIMSDLGFKHLYDLKGGYLAWQKSK